VTPIELVSQVITEQGVLAGDKLIEMLKAVHAYPGLRGRAE